MFLTYATVNQKQEIIFINPCVSPAAWQWFAPEKQVFPVRLSRLPRLGNPLIPSAIMTAARRNCKLKTDRDRPGGIGTNLWSWVLFGDRSWSVTCSRCCWWSWQGLGPDPQTTAACKQEGQNWHSCTSRSNSWQMSRATSGLHTSTVYTYTACLNEQGSVNIIIILRNVIITQGLYN